MNIKLEVLFGRLKKDKVMEEKTKKINWYPGHMKVAMRELKMMLSKIDVVVYILDARAPISSINPSLSYLAKGKKILYVINKIDLADKVRVNEILKDFAKKNLSFITMNSTMIGSDKLVKSKIKQLCQDKIEKSQGKLINPIIRAVVVGVPNCGKSTFINSLLRKAKMVTGNRPGVTKIAKLMKIGDNIEIFDTPGTLYPNLQDQTIAKKLFYIGSIKDEIMKDVCPLAEDLLEMINERYPLLLKARYGEDLSLESIAKKRNYLLSKDELDIERTAIAVIDDFRKGRIGKITLD